jgi:ABC-type Fe3+-siderophore transport system permease subunit
MVSSLFSSGTSFIKLVADPNDQLPSITYWLMGSLSGTTKKDVSIRHHSHVAWINTALSAAVADQYLDTGR